MFNESPYSSGSQPKDLKTKDQRKFGGTLIPKKILKYLKKDFFQKRIGKVRNNKFGCTPVEKHCLTVMIR